MACVVEQCKSHSSRKANDENESFTFHRFPNDEVLKNKWTEYINRPNWTPKKHSRICSKHFTEDSFVPNDSTKWRRLKSNAIPTLNIPKYTDCFVLKPDSPIEDNNSVQGQSTNYQHQYKLEPLEETNTEPTAIDLKTEIVTTDFDKANKDETEASSEKKIKLLEKQVNTLKNVSKRRLRKINTLTKRITRLSKKHADFNKILLDNIRLEEVKTKYINMLDIINRNDIIKRFIQKQCDDDQLTREYSLDIKKFAVTLHHVSPKAYSFVWEQFKNVLPHPYNISVMYKCLDCRPRLDNVIIE